MGEQVPADEMSLLTCPEPADPPFDSRLVYRDKKLFIDG